MGTNQETLIYIEDKDKLDASVAANAFAHSKIKNRVYINTLGAKLGMKFLASEDIDVSNVYNIHSIKKVLEEVDVADIMLSNIHIDVRVVYDENAIFIPKSHFEYGLTPDIYLVFKLAKDMSCVTFLGYFEPSLINKNNANSDFYFIEKEKLSPVASLKKFISDYKGNTNRLVPKEEIENSERIIMAMADNDVSDEDRRYLIKQLTQSAELRDKFIEYENFETLSYKAMTDTTISKKPISEDNIVNLSTLDGLDNIQKIENTNSDNELLPIDGLEDITLDDIFSKEELGESGIKELDELDGIGEVEDKKAEDETAQLTNSTAENKSQPSNNIPGDIGGTIAGAAAGAVAGATIGGAISATAGEILNTMNTVETTIDTVGDVANAIEGVSDLVSTGFDTANIKLDDNVEVPNKDNVKEENAQIDTISLENIDISNLEDVDIPQNNIKEETISLDNIEVADEVNTDFIDTIDNKISFDNIELPTIDEEVQNPISDTPTISLDNVDISSMEENFAESTNEPLISLGDDLEDLPNDIEDVDITLDENNLNEIPENNAESAEPLVALDDIADVSLDEPEKIDFENTEKPEHLDQNTEASTDVENNDIEELNLDSIDDLVSPETTETTENTVAEPLNNNEFQDNEEVQEGFGNALIENLTNEELENITIDDLGINDSVETANIEDISSNDLLSQIDDVLNSSATADKPVSETTSVNSFNEVAKGDFPEFDSQAGSQEVDTMSIDDLLDELGENETISVTPNDAVNNDEEFDRLANMTAEQPEIIENSEENNNASEEINNSDEEIQNDNTENNNEDNGNLEMLFSDTDTESDMDLDDITSEKSQSVPGQALFPDKKKQSNQKTLIVAAALVAVVAASSTIMFLKSKDNSASDVEPINTNQNEVVNTQTSTDPQNVQEEDILATNTPNIDQNTAQVPQTKQQVKELKNTAMNKKPVASGSYLQVNKLVWNVPSNLSNSAKMQNYLRTTGKSLKLALSADLLLANEYAYTNQMKVNLKVNNNGEIQQATIASSSGSTQIDNIVLQSVKDTLNAVKPPVDEAKGQNFNLALIIYF